MLKISVRCIAPCHNDESVEGVYHVHFNDDRSLLSKAKQASIALDIFHSQISVLDDFEITVVDEEGNAVGQDKAHVHYSASDAGSVDKVSDVPMYVEGEDAGLSAEDLDYKYNRNGEGEHPKFSRSAWRNAVANEDTTSGYWQWAADQLNEAALSALRHVNRHRPDMRRSCR